ncbi:unnamed protein product [Kuraishia capsulata CBS 1993]|uniref:NmrA-like domain-containing protein n=1 Tax=Kuraishia capsulata CBS 1993 TaxID=1382522 RepID=W6MP30_9ASCO|nr:uncharacterized protein KUCA_T00003983001 [Kuraishia capsulata CBS 1993]CDK28003.1 unnamed protein product [Kuraishia capsulata CBS 1993]
MKIAIAGPGDLAKYQVEEFLKASLEVVVLSRREKEWFQQKEGVDFRIVDFTSVDSITENLRDCDGLVSCMLDMTMNSVTVHLNMIEAMLKTEKCKKFLPAEYGGDIMKYPDQPSFYYENHQPVREKLRSLPKGQLEYSLLAIGYLCDYFVPSKNRYIKDFDPFPLNLKENTLIIPGTGDERVSYTPTRDVAKAIASLFLTSEPWEDITWISGETTTWNKILAEDLTDLNLTVSTSTLTDSVKEMVDAHLAKDEDRIYAAAFKFWVLSDSLDLPEDLVAAHKKKYFSDIHFRTISEFRQAAKDFPESIV